MIRKCIVLIAAILVASLNMSYGQLMPVTTTIKTPHGNVPYTYFVPSMRNYYHSSEVVSLKHEFTVFLNNDSIFKTKTRINIQEEGSNFITVKDHGNTTKIFPSDTRLIVRPAGEGRVLKGIPADSCWLFLVDKGAINRYSFLAETGTAFVSAIQNGDDGPIVPLTKENLLSIIGDDAKASKHAASNNFQKAIDLYNQHKVKDSTKSK